MRIIFYLAIIVLLSVSACLKKIEEPKQMYDNDLKSYNSGLIALTQNNLWINKNYKVLQYDFDAYFIKIIFDNSNFKNINFMTACDSFIILSGNNSANFLNIINVKTAYIQQNISECFRIDSFFISLNNYSNKNTFSPFQESNISITKILYNQNFDRYFETYIDRFANSRFPQYAKSLTQMDDSLIFFHNQSNIYKINFKDNNPQVTSVYQFNDNKNETSKMHSKGNNLYVNIENKIYCFSYAVNNLNLIATIE